MITKRQLKVKRIFDITLVVLVLPVLIIPIFLLVICASIDIKKNGLYNQYRVGQHGKLFKIYKIRTLKDDSDQLGYLKKRATVFGNFLRRTKLNELPQIYNVLIGDMSFVGPRPDLVGFADELKGEDRIILKVKPGVTGPATLKYRNEEHILEEQKDPILYNKEVIWVDKVKINKKYVMNYSFYLDLKLIIKTVFKNDTFRR